LPSCGRTAAHRDEPGAARASSPEGWLAVRAPCQAAFSLHSPVG